MLRMLNDMIYDMLYKILHNILHDLRNDTSTLGIEIFCCGIFGILILGNITFGSVGKDFVELLCKTIACIDEEDVSICSASSCS